MAIEFVQARIPEAILSLDALRFKQVPFATALALTRIAAEAQAEVRKQLPKRFTIRRSWVASGIRTTRATKRKPESSVYTVDEFMALQESGGVKRGRKAQAIPVGVRKSKRQVVGRARWPKALSKKPKHFIAQVGGTRGVFKRTGRGGRGSPKLLWRFESDVRVRPRFEFEETVAKVMNDRFQFEFGRAFAQALGSAR